MAVQLEHSGLLKHQLDFMYRNEDKRVALVTGVGCGKTMIAAQWLIWQASEGQNSIVSAQNYSALHKVVFAEIQRQCRRFGQSYEYNKQDKVIVFPNGATIFGASSEAYDSVLGLTNISNYLADEAAYSCEQLRNNCEERCRGVDLNGRIIKARYRYTTTPSSLPTSLWFRELVKKHPEIVIHATTYDNDKLDPSYVEDQIEKYGGPESPFARQQIFGEFTSAVSNKIALPGWKRGQEEEDIANVPNIEKFASRDITKTGFPFFDSGDASFEIEVAPDRKSVKIRAKSESPMRGDHTLMEKGKDVGKCIITQEFTLEFGAEPVIKDLKIGQTFA